MAKYEVTVLTTATVRAFAQIEAESMDAAIDAALQDATDDMLVDWEIQDLDLDDSEVHRVREIRVGKERNE